MDRIKVRDLIPDAKNANRHTERGTAFVSSSLQNYGAGRSILLDKNNRIIAGNLTAEQANAIGIENVRVVETDGTELVAVRRMDLDLETDPRAKELGIADNRSAEVSLDWDPDNLRALEEDGVDLSKFFSKDELKEFALEIDKRETAGKLSEKFGIPPFSVLNAREGWWQERKRSWLSLGIESEAGRGDNLLRFSETVKLSKKARQASPGQGENGTSIFDPVLCEIAYRWFSPKGGTILDPFAGGSVRGIVASKLGRQYVGCDLRPEQVEANRIQAEMIVAGDETLPPPVWAIGDSREIDLHCKGVQADLVFSCPPYADLERYSDDPRDLSTMSYEDFLSSYREIIQKSASMLRDNRFACFVVGDVRDKKGNYRNFPGDTIRAFEDTGMRLYNEAVLITAIGSLPMRVGRQFSSTRKLGKTHQNVLIFLKGDARKAVEAIGDCEFGEIQQETPEE